MKNKRYYKQGIEVGKPLSIAVNGRTFVPPTDDLLLSLGYEIREEEVQQYEQTYKDKVVSLIREKYSIDDELAILRQRDTKTNEFEEYNEFCETCKIKARSGQC